MSTGNFHCIQHTIPAGHIRHYPRSTAHTQEEELSLAVKQYKPRHYEPQPGDVTILACHANGFPKELYEPLWDALYGYSGRERAGFRIRGIWIADAANQGDSGVLNDGKLGNEPSWHDTARDYLALVNHFRKEMRRPIVGIGHSMGATVMLNLAILHPRLLTSVIPIEPSLYKSHAEFYAGGVPSVTFRRDAWPTKDAAMGSVSKHPFFKVWDPRVMELYKTYGLKGIAKSVPKQEAQEAVILKTNKHQEATTYARAVFPAKREHNPMDATIDRTTHPELFGVGRSPTAPLYRPEATATFAQLPFLRPSCLYIWGAKSNFGSAQPASRKEKLEITGTGAGGSGGAADGRVKETFVEGGTHWLPFERPEMLAQEIGSWLDREMDLWRAGEAREVEEWQEVPSERRGAVNDDWVYWMKRISGKEKKPEPKSAESKL